MWNSKVPAATHGSGCISHRTRGSWRFQKEKAKASPCPEAWLLGTSPQCFGSHNLRVQKIPPGQNIPQFSCPSAAPGGGQVQAPSGPGLNLPCCICLSARWDKRDSQTASKTPVYSFSSQETRPNSWLVMRRGEYSAGLQKGRKNETAEALA